MNIPWNEIIWVTSDNPPNIIPGVDYFFHNMGGMINNGYNSLVLSGKLGSLIAEPRGKESRYYYDFKYDNLRAIKIDNTWIVEDIKLYLESNYHFYDPADLTKIYFYLRGDYNGYKLQRWLGPKKHRAWSEFPREIKIEIYNKFITNLNQVI